MKLSRIQRKRMRKIVATLKDNMIEDLVNNDDGSIVTDILGRKSVSAEVCCSVLDEVIDRLFK